MVTLTKSANESLEEIVVGDISEFGEVLGAKIPPDSGHILKLTIVQTNPIDLLSCREALRGVILSGILCLKKKNI